MCCFVYYYSLHGEAEKSNQFSFVCFSFFNICLQCFDAVGWAAWHPACKKTEWWGAGVVICLQRGADLHIAQRCYCHSLSLASLKSRLVFPSGTGSSG